MSVFELKDKIAIVTGGGRGVGKGIALEYARAGANVVVASRNQENLERIAAEIKALGRESLVVPTDVCISEQVDNMVKQTVDRFGRIDILVNTAGAAETVRFGEPEGISPEFWRASIELNLTSQFFCSLAAGKVMIEQKSGKIVNITSICGVDANPLMTAYSAAKAGVINLTASLAAAWAQYNINVNAIAPGAIITEKYEEQHVVVPTTTDDGTPLAPLQLPSTTEQVGHLAVFLASEASIHITGEAFGIWGIRGRSWPFRMK